MSSELPAISQQHHRKDYTETASYKQTPKYKLTNLKQIRSPFERSTDFSLRSSDRVPQYNPLKDRYLQQFFRREQRIKLLNIFSNDVSVDNQEVIQKLALSSKNKLKSSYQNLVDRQQYSSKSFLLSSNKTAFRKEKVSNPEETSKRLKVITQPHQRTNGKLMSISKGEFHDFLSKAKEKLKSSFSLSKATNS